jgi:hypothetical protein
VAKKAFALRIDEQMLVALQRWADDEFRSVNGQIEFLLREALLKSGRMKWQQAPQMVLVETDDSNADAPASEDLSAD